MSIIVLCRLAYTLQIRPVEVRMTLCAYGYRWQKAHTDLDNPGGLLNDARLARTLHSLCTHHGARDEAGEGKRGRPQTCGAAPRIHAGGFAESDGPTARRGLGARHAQEMSMIESRVWCLSIGGSSAWG